MPHSGEVVLVHGMWHQPAHFDALRSVLQLSGHVVRAPRLHRGSLARDAAAVQQAIADCSEPPVLVAHSYGGAVAGHTTGARAMLFVTAFVLEVGESCADVAGPPPCRPAIVSNPDGSTSLDPTLAPEYFFGDCAPADVERAVALLVPQEGGHGRAPATARTWREVPTRYVVCEQDRAIDVDVQRRLAARCDAWASIPTGHSPFLSHPEVLAAEVGRLD
jgi:pimeloyl-ACP methyl ester carboxylesterase